MANSLIEWLDRAWLDDNFSDWPQWKRLACALAGIGNIPAGILFFWLADKGAKDVAAHSGDPEVQKTIATVAPSIPFLSIGFAFLVSWRNMRAGPARLYLAGFLLPAFVWFKMDRIFIGHVRCP